LVGVYQASRATVQVMSSMINQSQPQLLTSEDLYSPSLPPSLSVESIRRSPGNSPLNPKSIR